MLKISLRNVGPIYAYDFDVEKPIHLIYGKNNIGKSHAISIVYLILKNISTFFIHDTADFSSLWRDKFLVSFKNYIYTLFENMDNFKNKFNPSEDTSITLVTASFSIEIGFEKDFFIKNIAITNNKNLISTFKKVNRFVQNLHFLPASRSGLYQGLGAFAPLLAKISQARMYVKNLDISIPNLPEPVSDYFLALSSIKKQKPNKNIALQNIVNDIEKNIIKSTIQYNEEKQKIEYFDEHLQLRLDISQTSSMIAEIAPIVAYLKYRVGHGADQFILIDEPKMFLNPKNIQHIKEEHYALINTLFIEEPEAHLHPSVQVEMMRIFVALAKQNVHIVMTTHSDFMFNELTNLILADQIKPEQVASVHLVMTEKGSLDKGDMQATAEGIEDFNFSEVAEAMFLP
jgi:predicted ATPase